MARKKKEEAHDETTAQAEGDGSSVPEIREGEVEAKPILVLPPRSGEPDADGNCVVCGYDLDPSALNGQEHECPEGFWVEATPEGVPLVRRIKSEQILPRKLTAGEVRKQARALADLFVDHAELMAAKKEVMADFKARDEAITNRMDKLAKEIREGEVEELTETEIIRDLGKKTITIVRTDSNAVVEQRDMTPDELQFLLDEGTDLANMDYNDGAKAEKESPEDDEGDPLETMEPPAAEELDEEEAGEPVEA
jgi:hypothetical protein